jgi:hypothetical protein
MSEASSKVSTQSSGSQKAQGAQGYSVVMTGKVHEGHEVAQVKANVSKLFKIGSEQVEKMFVGKPVAIRRGVEKKQAEKLLSALTKAGVVAIIKGAALAVNQGKKQPSPVAKPATAAPITSTIVCPRCAHEQNFMTACELCKMDFTLHIKRLEKKEQVRSHRRAMAK